ncbi:hypothetical protein C8R46DRAFT_596116 [Mycena filopes]|nr:hypothetical protein C8R46DRAFT_596116 [Mycena filopes]
MAYAIVFVLGIIVPSALATCSAADPALFSRLVRPDVSYASLTTASPPSSLCPSFPAIVACRLRVHRRSDSTKTRSQFHGQHPPCCPLFRAVQSRPSESSLHATLSIGSRRILSVGRERGTGGRN